MSVSVVNKGGGAKVQTETKNVTAGTSPITVRPSSDKVLISEVTVNPTPSQSKSISPKPYAQTVYPDAGYLLSSVPVSGEPNAISQNIKKGVSILGVPGSLEEAEGGMLFSGMVGGKPSKVKFKYDCDMPGIWGGSSPSDYKPESGMGDFFSNLTYVEFEVKGALRNYTCKNIFPYNLPCKIKVKNGATSIGFGAFEANYNNGVAKVPASLYIPISVTSIPINDNYNAMCYSWNSESKIYCGAPSKPAGYLKRWASCNMMGTELTQVWGVTEAQFDAL